MMVYALEFDIWTFVSCGRGWIRMLGRDIVEVLGRRYGSIPVYVVRLSKVYQIGASKIARSFNSEALQVLV